MAQKSFLEYTKNNTNGMTLDKINFDNFLTVSILDKARQIKIENPKKTKKQVSKELGISSNTLSKFADELGDKSFQKKKVNQSVNFSKCDYCKFIAKS